MELDDTSEMTDATLPPSVREAALAALEARDRDELRAILEPLHPADIAEFLEHISSSDRQTFVDLHGADIDGAVLSDLSEGVRDEIIADMPEQMLVAAFKDLESDDVVYLTEDLDPATQKRVLDALERSDRIAVQKSLQYDEDTAGRLMQREVEVAPEHWTVGDTIDHMRSRTDLPQSFYDVIVVDPGFRPVGKVALGRIMGSTRETRLTDIMTETPQVLSVTQPQEEVARIFNKYHLISAPVVDEHGRLAGVVTIDDAMEVLEEETEEDMRLLAGVGDEELSDGVGEIARSRFTWLSVNLLTAILASAVIALFSDTIDAIVALAVLMPIVASMGGNAGTQTLTVAVRSLATRRLSAANLGRFVGREAFVGLINGVGFAVLIGVLGAVYYSDATLGLVLAVAMVGNMIMAGFAGVLIPVGLERAGVDPALASGTFVTTITDVFGFFAFLGLAAMFLI